MLIVLDREQRTRFSTAAFRCSHMSLLQRPSHMHYSAECALVQMCGMLNVHWCRCVAGFYGEQDKHPHKRVVEDWNKRIHDKAKAKKQKEEEEERQREIEAKRRAKMSL